MNKVVTLNLPDDLVDALESEVAEGRAPSLDAAAEAALREALQPDTVAGIPIEELGRLAKEAIDDPEPSLTSEEAWDAIHRMQDENLAAFKRR